VARLLAEFGYYLGQFNSGQRKELLEAVVQTVTVEGPAQARLRLDLPVRPLGKFDRTWFKMVSRMVSPEGFEPSTRGLKVRYSTS
jgi:hypothetical protein